MANASQACTEKKTQRALALEVFVKEVEEIPPVRSALWPEERIIRECLKGNQDAWAGLIERYKNLIYSIPFKYGFSPEDANDIFQQVCVQLLTYLPEIREPRTLPAWLMRVTSHECTRWSKGRSRFAAPDAISELEDLSVPGNLPENLRTELEREQSLREAMWQIAPRCRELLRMLFYEEPAVPYEDVAKQLGLAKGSIGFIRMRCLKRLRQVLGENYLL